VNEKIAVESKYRTTGKSIGSNIGREELKSPKSKGQDIEKK
jgi:hypothetical protein